MNIKINIRDEALRFILRHIDDAVWSEQIKYFRIFVEECNALAEEQHNGETYRKIWDSLPYELNALNQRYKELTNV